MRKALLLIAAGALLVILVKTLPGNEKAIARAQADAARLATQRDSLVELVRRREQKQAALTIRIETQQAEADRLRDSVIALERRRAAAQLSVREIRTTGALQDRLRSAFRELGDSAWGLTTVPLDRRDTIGIEYIRFTFDEYYKTDEDAFQRSKVRDLYDLHRFASTPFDAGLLRSGGPQALAGA